MTGHADENTGVISYRLTSIEKTLSSMSDSMRQLVVLEQKHLETREALARAFATIDTQDKRIRELETERPKLLSASSSIDKLDKRVSELDTEYKKRLKAIDEELPTLKMARGWVIAAVIGAISGVSLLVLKLVFKI